MYIFKSIQTITIKKAIETAEAQTNETQTTPKTVKRAPLKANPNTDVPNEISGNINDKVKSGLSGSYKLVGKTIVTWEIINDPAIEDRPININNDVTIDLNGKKLQLYDKTYFYIKSGKRLTIIDSQADKYKPTTATTNVEGVGKLSSLTTETDSQDNRNIPKILDYYVTEPEVSGTTTTDTTKEYKVDFSHAGRIFSETSDTGGTDSTFMIEKGGTLDFKSGVAYNTGPHVVATHGSNGSGTGTLNLSGGYLIGNRSSNVIWNNAGNVLNISGGVITNGYAENGGGIYNNDENNSGTGGGTINMTGGYITGNEAYSDGDDSTAHRYSGGGIYMKSGVLYISGNAYITNNRKSSGESSGTHFSLHGGGGVAADNDSQVNMSGGYVTGNYSNEAGGGLYIGYFNHINQSHFAKLTLTGGVIASNIAQTGEGGGLRVGGSGRVTISAASKSHPIYITNNQTYTGGTTQQSGDWGGGGIFVQQNGQLHIMNTIITSNTADGFGAGVSACPTGNTNITTDQGAAIYGNTANGRYYSRGSGEKTEDAVAYDFYHDPNNNNNKTFYQDYFLAHGSNDNTYKVTNTMLGGGSENYSGTFNDKGSYEQEWISRNQTAYFIGLSADPSDTDKANALNAATTYISGNYSRNHGGGIMTNGILTLGESNTIIPTLKIDAYKSFVLKGAGGTDARHLSLRNNQFTFDLYKHTNDTSDTSINPQWNGKTFTAYSGQVSLVSETGNETATSGALGKIAFSIPNSLYDEAGSYDFYLVEKDTDEHYVTFDHSVYQIHFRVEESGTTTVNNVETKKYNIQALTITKYENGTPTPLTSSDYSYADSKLTLYNTTTGTFQNTEQSYDLQLTKIEKNKSTKQLPGAEFKLYRLENNYNDERIQTVNLVEGPVSPTTNNDGKYTFTSLRGGQLYYLKETKAPDQYKTSGPWMIKIEKNGAAKFYDADCIETDNTLSTGYLTLTKNSNGTFWKDDGSQNIKADKDNVLSITISDEAIQYKLPDTGGSGIEQ
ncbi:SpaA isopeptide-forming pilin-related protein [Sharpea azabuensis]|uniref:SpaA isopeptide-forming pilin-related protein n=1 Tax=Sharpea azabuensis TaxID=322505 RepID=UPI00156903B2|nr:SpaA isopeptide-forming pilin-related protein [Sharpea azabuensis]